jgi:hypothetical protein
VTRNRGSDPRHSQSDTAENNDVAEQKEGLVVVVEDKARDVVLHSRSVQTNPNLDGPY